MASRLEPEDRISLRDRVTTHFNEGELRTLCFELDIDYDSLPAAGNADKARELIAYCERHGRITELRERLKRSRPNMNWDAPIKAKSGFSTPKLLLFGLITLLVFVSCTGIFVWNVILPQFGTPVTPTQALSATLPPSEQIRSPTSGAIHVTADGEQILTGLWQISHQSQSGTSIEQWEIHADGGTISIAALSQAVSGVPLPGDYRDDLSLSNVSFDGQTLQFTTRRFRSVTYTYTLTIIAPDRIEGSYTSIDTTLSDQGIIQGEEGIINDTGKVIMLKQAD